MIPVSLAYVHPVPLTINPMAVPCQIPRAENTKHEETVKAKLWNNYGRSKHSLSTNVDCINPCKKIFRSPVIFHQARGGMIPPTFLSTFLYSVKLEEFLLKEGRNYKI